MNDEVFWSRPAWTGADYKGVLRLLHKALRPEKYLEIGVDKGATLAIANCASIGVDPKFALDRPALGSKPCCLFFQRTSDAFFRDFDPSVLLQGPVDLAFLDGLHEHETLLRDFRNTERFCRSGSVILMHDCMPVNSHVARRDQADRRYRELAPYPGHWAGDVWKTAYILIKSRPDLKIIALDAGPTGLIVVTRLSPGDPAPDSVYAPCLAEVAPLDIGSFADRFYAALNVSHFSPDDDASALVAELTA